MHTQHSHWEDAQNIGPHSLKFQGAVTGSERDPQRLPQTGGLRVLLTDETAALTFHWGLESWWVLAIFFF